MGPGSQKAQTALRPGSQKAQKAVGPGSEKAQKALGPGSQGPKGLGPGIPKGPKAVGSGSSKEGVFFPVWLRILTRGGRGSGRPSVKIVSSYRQGGIRPNIWVRPVGLTRFSGEGVT